MRNHSRLVRLLVRLLTALLTFLDPPHPGTAGPAAPLAAVVPPMPSRPPSVPLPRSRYAAEAAAEQAADQAGAVRRYPPPGPRPYAPAVYHRQRRPERDSAAVRLTQGRRRAELWLATWHMDPPWPVHPHGVRLPTGGVSR
jgi:hypothetical protein